MSGTGRVGNLTKDQEKALEKFKEIVKDVLQEKHTDHHLLRFLRARNFNLKKTEEMFRKDVEWRAQNRAVLKDITFPEVVEKYWVGGEIGCDKEGHITLVIPLCRIDPKGIVYSLKADEAIKVGIRFIQMFYNRMKENSLEHGRNIEGMTLIFDIEGLSPAFLWKPSMKLFTEVVQIMEQHYPETIKRALVMRAPSLFPVAYNLVKPFIHEETRKKIKFLKGSNWQKTILNYVDADILPKHWGGTKVDPDGDPMCPSIIRLGGKIPESYYVKDHLKDNESLTKLVMSKSSSKELKYAVDVPKSAIRYQFKTDEGEVSFGITYIQKGKQPVTVLPLQKVQCHVTPVDGEIAAENVGSYVIRFENSAKLTSKTLSYQIEVLEPDTDDEVYKIDED
ncbi:SEC14-like protein 2 [Holothuria leucospilota]|uniref:SEC14-like protein 2 n=1 Tax=Holothuria leucospilota TaxID=206669 RepID=A0A9Q1CE28_HOLLE|nr:SEC14-like protein 2 [Holothuria leucospilota]